MGFLQPNYNKPGEGVRKDAPQKKEFVRFLEIYARKFWNLMVANLWYLLCCIPVITIGLADVGLTRITRSFSQEKFAFVRQDFFESIQKNWKQALVSGIINLVITVVLIFDISYFYAVGKGAIGVVMLALILMVAVVFLMMRYYIPLLIITFKLSLKQIYKNAFLLALAGLKRNIVATLVLGGIYGLLGALMWVNLAIGMTIALLLILFILPAFRSFLIQFCIFPVVKKHIIDPYYEAHPDEDHQLRKDLNLEVTGGEGEEEPLFADSLSLEEDTPTEKFVMPSAYPSSRRGDDDDDTI